MSSELNRVNKYIEQCEELAKNHPGPIAHSLHFKATTGGPHIYFSFCVHGNEVGSLPALFRLIQEIQSQKISYPGPLTFSLGNVAAMRAGRRYIEMDMNRHYGDGASSPPEAQRANELAQLIDKCHVFIDIHQTIEPTLGPFYVLSEKPENLELAQALGATQIALMRKPAVEKGSYKTATNYAFAKNKTALTIELSQRGFVPEAEELAFELMKNVLLIYSQMSKNLNFLRQKSQSMPPLKLLDIEFYQAFDGPLCRLNEGFSNLQVIKENQVVGRSHSGKDLVAPFRGVMLFPKYPERDAQGVPLQAPPKDIYALARKR